MTRNWVGRRSDPARRAAAQEIVEKSIKDVQSYFAGQTALAAVNRLVDSDRGVHPRRTRQALAIGVVNFVGAYIPYFGAFIGGAFAVLMALGDGGVNMAVAASRSSWWPRSCWRTSSSPSSLGSSLNMSPLTILLATTFGGMVAGIIGLILAAPVMAIGLDLTRKLRAVGFFGDDQQPDATRNGSVRSLTSEVDVPDSPAAHGNQHFTVDERREHRPRGPQGPRHGRATPSGRRRRTVPIRSRCSAPRTRVGYRSSSRSVTAGCPSHRSRSTTRRGGDHGRRPRSHARVRNRHAALRRCPPVQLRRLRITEPDPGVRRQRLRRDSSGALGVGREAAGGELRPGRQRRTASNTNRHTMRSWRRWQRTGPRWRTSRSRRHSMSGTPSSRSTS